MVGRNAGLYPVASNFTDIATATKTKSEEVVTDGEPLRQ
jgi:hypothetical protein